MSEVKLLPLPELHLRYGHFGEDALAYATDYARANMAELLAENERLRAEVGELHMHAQRRDQYAVEKAAQALDWKKRAERLAEALRDALEYLKHHLPDDMLEMHRAALDQEGGNG